MVPMLILKPITMHRDWSNLTYTSSPVRDQVEERSGFSKDLEKRKMDKNVRPSKFVAIYLWQSIPVIINIF